MGYRLGIDIGGTFTDATLINESNGDIRIAKVPSTPRDPSLGFLEVTHRILQQAGLPARQVRYLVHGTTVATNAIIEGKVARTGFITTEGFGDMLEIARQTRPALYDLQFEKPRPLVPRHLCFGIPERMDAQGQVLKSLDEGSVRQVANALLEEKIESLAVCLLHAYVNPSHEQRVCQILAEELPGVAISLSSEVAPEFREYSRASTTIINACIRPVVARYLESIENRLRSEGLQAELLIMQSSGGVMTFASASARPVLMVESGPAAGVVSATHLGKMLGRSDLISFDMGGTTAKVGLILKGKPQVTKDYEVGSTARPGSGSARGSGYPIRTPVIELVEIGAGGGSIAWVDSGGVLRVGPQSAGADPGPVCYGWGGQEPTITDANLVLGRLNPDYFLGGDIELNVEAAARAIEERCAKPLGLDIVTAANGIVEIANAAMVNALRLVSVQRGYDPRDFAIVAFGGAGPVHAGRLAYESQAATIIVPMSPGIFSALGLLVTDLKHDYAQTCLRRLDTLDAGDLTEAYQRLEAQGCEMLQREGVLPEQMSLERQAELRYVGQSYELCVPVPPGRLQQRDLFNLADSFHREHDRAYGFSAPEEPVELVNVRLSATGHIPKPSLRVLQSGHSDQACKSRRLVYFAEAGGYVDCPIYDRYRLGASARVDGPAVVEEIDSTTIIHPGWVGQVDHWGNIIIDRQSTR
ncbi:MAG: hydantoinase/oxoprolinase family protein [Anaerolineae bacterium]